MKELRRRILNPVIAVPRDHGSWVFLLSPLTIGLFAGGKLTLSSVFLIIAALSAFLIRQPIITAVKTFSGRIPKSNLPIASFWIAIYGIFIVISAAGLIFEGNLRILVLAFPALPVFGWHLYLVSRRTERKQAGVEILGTGILALAAPAAYWIGKGNTEPMGWILWVLVWLQSAASIVFAYMRLEQRKLEYLPSVPARLRLGYRAIMYTSLNVLAAGVGGLLDFLPSLIFVPYLLQWLETAWGTIRPAIGAKPVHIGVRQLLVSTLFTIIFIFCWR